jgi:hypothetical protein
VAEGKRMNVKGPSCPQFCRYLADEFLAFLFGVNFQRRLLFLRETRSI